MASEKRYQVFISSTFRDLIAERQAVLKAVLELDHMPAGMELFPAADKTAWQLIKDVIDDSDYYVLIIGGRYGSLDETGIGYTEKEYDYAVSSKKPVIAILHKNPNSLPRDKTETNETVWDRLQDFRKKVEERHLCSYWSSADDLKTNVILGLTSTMKRHPAIGWIRADQVPSRATIADILSLRERVAELESELELVRSEPPPGTEGLLQGDDLIFISFDFTATWFGQIGFFQGMKEEKYKATISPTWDEVFSGVAPVMINEEADADLRAAFQKNWSKIAIAEFQGKKNLKDKQLINFEFQDHDIDTCIVQLRALGLIRESHRKRSIKDTATYWSLTPYGDRLMVQLRAMRKPPVGGRQRTRGTVKRAPDDEQRDL